MKCNKYIQDLQVKCRNINKLREDFKKDRSCSWSETFNINISFLPKLIFSFHKTLKIPAGIFVKNQAVYKIYIEKYNQNSQTFLNKEQSFKTHRRLIRTLVQVKRQTYGSMEQNREPRSRPMCMWSIFYKVAKVIQGRKNNLFNSAGISTYKNMKLNLDHRPKLTENGS